MKRATFALTTAVSLGLAVPAAAQGADWTGIYAGGQIGTMDSETVIPLTAIASEEDILDAGFALDDVIVADVDGTFYGLHVGYMADLGTFVLGAEIDYDSIEFDELSVTFAGTKITEAIDDDTDDTVTRLKLRAGYDAGQFLPYATIGTARLESEGEATNGTFYGAGVAFLATDNFLIGGEILQHQFDDAFDSGLDIEATTMSVRASFKF